MLARGALCRLAADVPKTYTHDLPQLARFLRRTLLARNALKSPAARALSRAYTSALEARRSYATTASATKPTATVKKAVKAKAAKKPAPKKTPAPKKKVAAAKKATPAKKPKKKTVAKKAAPKKATPRKRVKKVLTPEQKEKATLTELRKKALKEPVTMYPYTAFTAYIGDKVRGQTGLTQADIKSHVADASRNWKTLTPAEVEHYNHIAKEKTVAKRAEYAAWIRSHTPEQIRIANVARAHLRKLTRGTLKRKNYPAHTSKLIDDRHVKPAATPFTQFVRERHSTGDLKGILGQDAMKLIANEWKALSASEKRKYEDAYQTEKESVAREKAAALA